MRDAARAASIRGLLLLLLLAPSCAHTPAWELPPPPVADAPVVDEALLHRTRLANGLEVIVLEDHRLPRFELGVVVRRGSGSETLEQAGLAAFTAELMERGAGERTALELAAHVDALGASLAVASDWDSLSAGVSGLSRDFDTLFDVLRDVVREPRFDEDEAERVRAEQLATLEKAREDPGTVASWNFARLLYGGHRYGLPAQGTPETVARLGVADAKSFHARLFVPGNAIFVASGDVAFEDVLARVEAALGDWDGGSVPAPGPPAPDPAPPARRIVVVDRPDLGQAQIVIGHEGIARTDERRVPALVMNTVLGQGGFSSRLMSVVRSDEGLTYSIGSLFLQRRLGGPFAVFTFTRVPETRRVVDLVLRELERMQSEPPEGEELARAKSQRIGSFALALETSGAVADALVDLSVHGLPADSLDTYRARIRAIGPEDVASVARELLHPERAAVVVVGPADALAPQLEGLGPVEVVKP